MSDHSEPAQTGENGDGEDQDYVEDTNNSLSEDLGDDNQASLVNEESALLNETSELDDTSDEAVSVFLNFNHCHCDQLTVMSNTNLQLITLRLGL